MGICINVYACVVGLVQFSMARSSQSLIEPLISLSNLLKAMRQFSISSLERASIGKACQQKILAVCCGLPS